MAARHILFGLGVCLPLLGYAQAAIDPGQGPGVEDETAQTAPEPSIPASTAPAALPGAVPPDQPASTVQHAAPRVIEWIGQPFAFAETTSVLTMPDPASPVLARIRAGMTIEVVGLMEGNVWLRVRLPDDSVGYAKATSIPSVLGAVPPVAAPPAAMPPPPVAISATPSAAEKSASAPIAEAATPGPATLPKAGTTLNGLATIFDTATVVVQTGLGQDGVQDTIPVKLAGVDGISGNFAEQMKTYLEANGSWLDCERSDSAHFICKLRDGTDLSEAALVNGAARAQAGAPKEYVMQEVSAKAARRGIWSNGEAAIDEIPFSGTSGPLPPGQYVAGVAYAPNGVPTQFAAAAPVDGLCFIDGQPFTLDEGIPAPLVYVPAIGWGFYDRWYKWRGAPGNWAGRLDRMHPRGSGMRDVELERHGLAPRESYFRGPIVRSTFGAAPGPEFSRRSYPPASARTISFPALRMPSAGPPPAAMQMGHFGFGPGLMSRATPPGRVAAEQGPTFGHAVNAAPPSMQHPFAPMHSAPQLQQAASSVPGRPAFNPAAGFSVRPQAPPPPVNAASAFVNHGPEPARQPNMAASRGAMTAARMQPSAPRMVAAAPAAVMHARLPAPAPAPAPQKAPPPVPPKK